MNTVNTTDRRRAPRYQYNAEVRLHRFDEPMLLAIAENISNSGLMVTRHGGQPAFGLGELLCCQLTDGPHPPINATCRVVWSRVAARPDKIAMGLQIEETNNSIRLDRLVRRSEVASTNQGIRFDPLCESGTWSPEQTNDDCHGGGEETLREETVFVARTPLEGLEGRRIVSLRLVMAIAAAAGVAGAILALV